MIEGEGLQGHTKSRDEAFVIVLSVAVVLGMVVALILIFLWQNHPAMITQGGPYRLAVAICPPFFLVGVVSAMTDSTLAVALAAGTIVFANASLYAGLAALVYWAYSIWGRSKS